MRERSQKEAVIFASGASGITNIAHVADKRVAFGQTNSTISFLAKVHFARAEIRAINLQSYMHLSGIKPDRDQDPSQPKGSADRDSETQAHKRVIEAVGLGRADVGVAPRRHFELNRYRRGGLVELHAYSVTSDVYVVRPGLDPDVARALQKSLVSFQSREEKRFLAQLTQNNAIEGFEAITDADFNDLRSAMNNEVSEFERGAERKAKDAAGRAR